MIHNDNQRYETDIVRLPFDCEVCNTPKFQITKESVIGNISYKACKCDSKNDSDYPTLSRSVFGEFSLTAINEMGHLDFINHWGDMAKDVESLKVFDLSTLSNKYVVGNGPLILDSKSAWANEDIEYGE